MPRLRIQKLQHPGGTTTDDSPRTHATDNYLKMLDTGEEDQQTRNLLSQIRKNILRISDDVGLTLKAHAQ